MLNDVVSSFLLIIAKIIAKIIAFWAKIIAFGGSNYSSGGYNYSFSELSCFRRNYSLDGVKL